MVEGGQRCLAVNVFYTANNNNQDLESLQKTIHLKKHSFAPYSFASTGLLHTSQ